MSDQTAPCGSTAFYPDRDERVACTLPEGHRAPAHCSAPPHIMYWPVDKEVLCPAWRWSRTAMGQVVVYCATPPDQHTPLEHEGRVGIHRVAWSDADLHAAGKAAKQILALLSSDGYGTGDLLPPMSALAARFGVAPNPTIKYALQILFRDGVVRPIGQRWMVT